MYSIYLYDKVIRIVGTNESADGIQVFHGGRSNEFPIMEHFKRFIKEPEGSSLVLNTPDPHWLFRYLLTYFVPREAAGGLVYNQKAQILFIFRHQKWDLPKGHPEIGETVEETAMREVEEECNIGELTIKASLPPTYHIFPLENDVWALKKTRWFLMSTQSQQLPQPQKQEAITGAEWIDQERLPQIFEQAYGSINELVSYAIKNKMF